MALIPADDKSTSAQHAFSITPSDSADLTHATRGIWVGGAGNIYVDTVGGETNVPFIGIAAGTLLPVAATRVRSTNTTATSMTGMY
jgi:hypothetical protein